jgi:hypothetical protein
MELVKLLTAKEMADKIEAIVVGGQGQTLGLMLKPRELELTYRMCDAHKTIIGTDGFFFKCYAYSESYQRAFAGAKFDIKLEDGTIIHATGQWWNSGYEFIEDLYGIDIAGSIGVSTMAEFEKTTTFQTIGYDRQMMAAVEKELKDRSTKKIDYVSLIADIWEKRMTKNPVTE